MSLPYGASLWNGMFGRVEGQYTTFGHFGQLSPAAVHSAVGWFNSWVKWCIQVSSIVTFTQNPRFLALKQLQTTLSIINALLFLIDCEQTRHQFWTQFLVDEGLCKMGNTLPSDFFNSSAILRYFNLRSAKKGLWSFFFLVFSGKTAEFRRPERSASICVSTSVSKSHLNHCFRRSRVQIKELLCLNSSFSHQKAILYQHTKFKFFHCLEYLRQ